MKSCQRAWFSHGFRKEEIMNDTDSNRRENAGEGNVFLTIDTDVVEGQEPVDEAIYRTDTLTAAAQQARANA